MFPRYNNKRRFISLNTSILLNPGRGMISKAKAYYCLAQDITIRCRTRRSAEQSKTPQNRLHHIHAESLTTKKGIGYVSTLGIPDIHRLGYVITMVVDALVPIRHQATSNHHADLTALSIENFQFTFDLVVSLRTIWSLGDLNVPHRPKVIL